MLVVDAAGQWAAKVARLAGADLPLVSLEHHYVVTDAIARVAGLRRELPVLRDPDGSFYVRQEGAGLLVGPFERGTVPWEVQDGFHAQLLPPNLDPYRSTYGFRQLADSVAAVEARSTFPGGRLHLAANRYQDAAMLAWLLPTHPRVLSLNLGSRRLVAADDYRNTTNGYTGLRADLKTRGGLTATAIYVLPQIRLPDDLPSVLDQDVRWDRESFARRPRPTGPAARGDAAA